MRTGYSLLLGEHVDAGEISHGDCIDFQIVCPACREALFVAAGEKRRFLPHYRASKANDADCEMRVGRLALAERDAIDAVGRGQQLRVFESVLFDAMIKEIFGPLGDPDPAIEMRRRVARAEFREFVRCIRSCAVTRIEECWSEVERCLHSRMSPFAARRQIRYGKNFRSHLYASGSFGSMAAVVWVALLAIHSLSGHKANGIGALAAVLLLGTDRQIREALRCWWFRPCLVAA